MAATHGQLNSRLGHGIQGTYSQPKGLVCAVCNLAFVLGKFDTEYSTMDSLAEAFRKPKEGQTVTDEFQACQRVTIEKINDMTSVPTKS